MRSLRNVVAVGLVCVVCLWCGAAGAVPAYVQGVPDWDQPVITGPPVLGGGWDAWCAPTAAANIMGYYRDLGVSATIGDALVFPNTNAWGAVQPKASDYQDDTADPGSSDPPVAGIPRGDLGWYMNTNDTGQTGGANPHAGTFWGDIKRGLDGTLGFQGYFPAHATGANVQNAATAASGQNTVVGGPFTVASVWPRIVGEIDAGRPMIGSFSFFPAVGNYVKVQNTGLGDLDNYEKAVWPTNNPGVDPATGEVWSGDLGHAVTIVGYWLAADGVLNPFWDGLKAPNCIIVHDNRDGYQANGNPWPLVLPFDPVVPPWVPPWVMNTEITIPEPATMTLASLAGGALLAFRRRRRAT